MTQARRPPRAPRRPSRPGAPHSRRVRDPRRRLVTVGVLVAMVMSLFAGRLLQLQGVEAAAYAATAEAERLRTVTISATRGAITDTHGIALATTVDAVNVTADQTQIADPVAVAAAVSRITGRDVESLGWLIPRFLSERFLCDYLDDGKLTSDEVDEVFKRAGKAKEQGGK